MAVGSDNNGRSAMFVVNIEEGIFRLVGEVTLLYNKMRGTTSGVLEHKWRASLKLH